MVMLRWSVQFSDHTFFLGTLDYRINQYLVIYFRLSLTAALLESAEEENDCRNSRRKYVTRSGSNSPSLDLLTTVCGSACMTDSRWVLHSLEIHQLLFCFIFRLKSMVALLGVVA